VESPLSPLRRPRAGSVAFWALRCALIAAGFACIVSCEIGALGGWESLKLFTRTAYHRYTAMAMLTGTLRLRGSLALLGYDEQVYNGAAYTNWGFGVPILELPFHAFAARRMRGRFFPDRAIFFFYLTALVPLLWAAFSRLLVLRGAGSRIGRDVLSWAATAFVLAVSLYPLMACRFIVYEETICYLVVCELAALGFYLFALRSWGSLPLVGMGVASGLGLLVRPTGLIHLGVWAALVTLESKRRKPALTFAVAAAPFIAFWMFSNWVRTGSPTGLGFFNQVVNNLPGTAMVRFGSACVDTSRHVLVVFEWLASSFFFLLREDAPDWLMACNFVFEERPPASREPFFGVAVLCVFAWIVGSYIARRERRLGAYAPLAALAILFGSYVYAGAGFAWRYVGDFWPLIILACVQYVEGLRAKANGLLGLPLALVLALASLGVYRRSLDPWHPSGYYGAHWETLGPTEAATMWDDFSKSRWSIDKPLPSEIHCGDAIDWPPGMAQGWYRNCSVDAVSNVYVGVRKKAAGEPYELRIKTEAMTASSLRVYLNGRLYTAFRDGSDYRTRVSIAYPRLHSAIVLATFRWTSSRPAAGKLLSVELS
jgi:hypothetical protein